MISKQGSLTPGEWLAPAMESQRPLTLGDTLGAPPGGAIAGALHGEFIRGFGGIGADYGRALEYPEFSGHQTAAGAHGSKHFS